MDVLYFASSIVSAYKIYNTFSISCDNRKTKESNTRSWTTQLSSVHGHKDITDFGALTRAVSFLLI